MEIEGDLGQRLWSKILEIKLILQLNQHNLQFMYSKLERAE